jgi:hypothetical protein
MDQRQSPRQAHTAERIADGGEKNNRFFGVSK